MAGVNALKINWIWQSAAKHYIVDHDMMKVQRLAGRRSIKRYEMRGLNMRSRPIEERFFEKVVKRDTGCHEWIGCIMKGGYGQIHYKGKTAYAHVMAYRIHNGHESVGDNYVLHKCDNRKCVNPDHLFLGSYYDNMDDMVKKVRQAAGEKNHHAKLNENHVKEIRKSDKQFVELAASYNVSVATIYDIKAKRSWRHI